MPTNGLAAKMGRYPTDGAMSMLGKVCLSLSHDLSPLDAPALNRAYNEGTTIYIRGLEPERKGKQYGTYLQAVCSYRKGEKVKQEFIRLNRYATVEDAIEGWSDDIRELRRIGSPQRLRSYGASWTG
jgi:hypothetical protein